MSTMRVQYPIDLTLFASLRHSGLINPELDELEVQKVPCPEDQHGDHGYQVVRVGRAPYTCAASELCSGDRLQGVGLITSIARDPLNLFFTIEAGGLTFPLPRNLVVTLEADALDDMEDANDTDRR